jgi:hypothetical protein
MKAKFLIIVVVLALVTMSFAFVSVKNERRPSTKQEPEELILNGNEPIGAFILDEK